MPTIEKELAISHSQAGFFFFLTSGGYLVGLLSSGLLASRTTHRLAIVVSISGVGVAMLTHRLCRQSCGVMRCGLFGVGFAAGLYMPSAIATITSLVDRRALGQSHRRARGGSNLAFFISPFIAELFLKWSSWRSALGTLGALALIAGAC